MDTNKTPPKGLALRKKPRLTAMERLAIETGLDAGKTPYAIAQEIGRPPKTVIREVRGRAVATDKGAVGRVSNRCAHRYECTRHDVCRACYQRFVAVGTWGQPPLVSCDITPSNVTGDTITTPRPRVSA